jgi:hypothetical protein
MAGRGVERGGEGDWRLELGHARAISMM